MQLKEKTLGIIGLGGIGREVARIAACIGMEVIAWNRTPRPQPGVPLVDLQTLLARADVISLHLALNDETRGLIDARFFAAARAGMTLVNTARGAVVALPDLLKALDAGILRGVALDVLPVEPVPRDSPLISDPRVILTPHAAFFSVEAERELRHKAVQNIVSWLRRGRPDYPVTRGTRAP